MPLSAALPLTVVHVMMCGCTGAIGDGPIPGPMTGDPRPHVPDPRDPERMLPPFEPPSGGLRRLTTVQYDNSIRDLLGDDIRVAGEIESDPVAEDGFRFSDSIATSVTTSLVAVERYDAAARLAAASALSTPERREALVGCSPASAGDPCVSLFLRTFLRRTFRRPVGDAELAEYMSVVAQSEGLVGDVFRGLEFAIATALQAPSFLYRVEVGTVGLDGTRALDDYELATRLSYFFWDTTPDDALLDAAERHELTAPEGLRREVMRLVDSPRARPALERFFHEWLDIPALEHVGKSDTVYPEFSTELARSMRGEIERVLGDAINGMDAMNLFTTSESWVNADLARLYGIELSPIGSSASVVEHFEAETQTDGYCTDFAGFHNLCANGEVAREIDVGPSGGRHVFRARVYGAQAGGEVVRMSLTVDGTDLRTVGVSAVAAMPEVVEAEVELAPGPHRFGVRFLNDYYAPPEDRDLRVDWLEVTAGGASSEAFARVTLPPERRGILTLGWFPTLYAQPIDTSPTQRGLFIRTRILCEDVPPPPAGVETTLPPVGGEIRTNRDRVARHLSDPVCAGCHGRMDPLGLPLEHFDGIGRYRETNNGAELDVSGDLDGVAFDGAVALGELLSADQRTVDCVVRQLYRHGLGLDEGAAQEIAIATLATTFDAAGRSVRELAVALATSNAFRNTGEPR